MQENLVSDRADFSLGKEPSDRDLSQFLSNQSCIVVWDIKQSRSSTITGKKQSATLSRLAIPC